VARITGAPFDIFPHPGMDIVKMGCNTDPLVGIPQDGYKNYSAGQSNEVDLKTLKLRRRPGSAIIVSTPMASDLTQ